MTDKATIVDIANEVIKSAHGQGHTKASKETINWSGLMTKSSKPVFIQTSKTQKRKLFTAKDERTKEMMKHLYVKPTDEEEVFSILTAVELERRKDNAEEEILPNNTRVGIIDTNLMNVDSDKQSCSVGFQPSFGNTFEANVKLTQTIQGPSKTAEAKPDKGTRRNSLTSTKLERGNSDFKILSRIPLAPKFKAWIQLPGIKEKKLSFPCPGCNEVVTQIHPGIKIPVEILQQIEEEKGLFTVEYYLWGFVTVTVWGKPYNMKMNDVLDAKNNQMFSRENLEMTKSIPHYKSNDNTEVLSVVRFVIKGEYQSRRVTYEIKLKVPSCILRRPSYNMLSLKCMCDTVELPEMDELAKILPINNKNLAKIILRWRQILYTFRHKEMSNENEWLWKTVLRSDTQLADTAQTIKMGKLCTNFLPIDKFLITMWLWSNGLTSFSEVEQPTKSKEARSCYNLVEQLYVVGVPVPVLSFLWISDDKPKSRFDCPLHKFKKGPMPKWEDMKEPIQRKMKAQLPDRVLNRFLQRWPIQDGWMSAALYLGVSHENIQSIACNESKFPTTEDKRSMVFKLWRMQHRRSSTIDCSQSIGGCTVQDLCKTLSEMGLAQSVYSFLWTDSETTP